MSGREVAIVEKVKTQAIYRKSSFNHNYRVEVEAHLLPDS